MNVQNEDNKCFLYSVLAKLHPVEKNTERLSNYEPYIEELKTDGISMPMRLQQIPKFEKMKNHMNYCFKYGGQKKNIPEEGKNINEFKDIAKQQKLPFCIYADTECILTKVDNGKKKNSTKKKNMKYQDMDILL